MSRQGAGGGQFYLSHLMLTKVSKALAVHPSGFQRQTAITWAAAAWSSVSEPLDSISAFVIGTPSAPICTISLVAPAAPIRDSGG